MRRANERSMSLQGATVKKLACFWRNQSGATAVMFALSLPAAMGAIGVASDFAIYNMKLQHLQSAADDAAIAGAKEYSVATSNPSSISAAAKNFAEANYKSDNPLGITATTDPKNKTVTVKIDENWSPFFAHFLGAAVTPVVAKATASAAGRGNICLLLLDPSASKTGHVMSGSKISANGCDIYSNSAAHDGIAVLSGAVIADNSTCSVGGVSNSGTITPAATTDCPVVDDPLASRSAPAFSSCDFTNYKLNNGSATLNPGTYCGGIAVSGNGVLLFNPGTYVLKDGEFKLTGNSSIKGNHVGFYLTGTTSVLKFSGNTSVNLTGATTGAMAGLLFFEDRASPLGRQHRINSNNAANLTGTIYLPKGNLLVDPGSKVGQSSAYTAIIAQQLLVRGGPELIMNSNYGATDVPVPDGIKASTEVVLLK